MDQTMLHSPDNKDQLWPFSDLRIFTLKSEFMSIRLSNHGARILSIHTPDHRNLWADIVGGYDDVRDYAVRNPYYGAICGRFANRIHQATLRIQEKNFLLNSNDGPHCLHGGSSGLSRQIWTPTRSSQESCSFEYQSPDGEMGFPGNLNIRVDYTILDQNKLKISYTASTDKPTVVNLAAHSYFNLNGGGSVLDHLLTIESDQITEVNEELIPTGRIVSIRDTVFDFTHSRTIHDPLITQGVFSFDHNYVLRSSGGLACTLNSKQSGRSLKIYTSQPGLQFYICNWGDHTEIGKNQTIYKAHDFVCLEPQHFPDSPRHPHFPDTTLLPGELYQHWCLYEFDLIT